MSAPAPDVTVGWLLRVRSEAFTLRFEVLAGAGPDRQLVVCDLDVDTVSAVRDRVGVLGNRIRLRSDS